MIKMVEDSVKQSSEYRFNFTESLTGSEYTPLEGLAYYNSLHVMLAAMKMTLCTNECFVM